MNALKKHINALELSAIALGATIGLVLNEVLGITDLLDVPVVEEPSVSDVDTGK